MGYKISNHIKKWILMLPIVRVRCCWLVVGNFQTLCAMHVHNKYLCLCYKLQNSGQGSKTIHVQPTIDLSLEFGTCGGWRSKMEWLGRGLVSLEIFEESFTSYSLRSVWYAMERWTVLTDQIVLAPITSSISPLEVLVPIAIRSIVVALSTEYSLFHQWTIWWCMFHSG